MCDHCHRLVDFAVAGCGKSWSETAEEGFTFQCLGYWKVDCLTAKLATVTDIVIERGGRVIARKTNGEGTTENMTCRKVTGEKVTVLREGGRDKGTGADRSRCDSRKDEGKKGSKIRCDQTEVNSKDDDRKKRGRKERNNRESGRGKVSNQGDAKRKSYSEAVIEEALRTERVFIFTKNSNRMEQIIS